MTTDHPSAECHASTSRVRRGGLLVILYGLALLPVLILEGPPMPWSTWLGTVVLGAFLIALSVIDFEQFRLPDLLTLPLAAVGLGFVAVFQWGDPLAHLAAAAAGFGGLFAAAYIYEKLRGRAGLGLGDAKLFAASGAWLGAAGLPSVLLYACAFGLLYAFAQQLRGRTTSLATAIPLGPFLAAGTWLVWFYGPLA